MRSAVPSVALLALLAAPVVAQARPDSLLTVEGIFGRHEYTGASMPDVHWLPSGDGWIEVRATPRGSEIVRVDAVSGARTVLAAAGTLVDDAGHPLRVEEIRLSDDGMRALLFHNSVRVWRQNTRGVYHVLDFATHRLTPISQGPGLQMFAKFSPDGRQVAFVRQNNLYVTDLATGVEHALTTDGSDVIINGTSDWVYEEELGVRDAFRWSPDGKRIAFWRFDQSTVPEYPLLDQMSAYPKVLTVRYPLAGAPNSRVRVGVVDVATRDTRWLETGDDTLYIATVEWADRDSIAIQRLNRDQNELDLLLLSATSGRGRTVVAERSDTWVDVDDDSPHWLAGGKMFLWASERGGWRSYWLMDRSGTPIRRLTADSVDVASLVAVDDARGMIYVDEATPTPMERRLVRYALLAKPERSVLTAERGTHRVSIAPRARFAIDVHSTLESPDAAELLELPAGNRRRVIERNEELRRTVGRLGTRAELFQIPMADGVRLNAWRLLPPSFDSTRRWPVLMYVYGGPGSQTVLDAWGGATRWMWFEMLAQKGYLVVSVDNRGTGARGRAFRAVVYQNLGLHESDDQIAAARWLAGQRWVDGARVGIWGWSYGGYMAALTAFRGGEVFRTAISVAPVSDWRLYDDIYTERYMRTPLENPRGYTLSSPQHYVSGLTAHYLVVHGTGDDNVHPQNTLQLIDKLQQAGKPFAMMIYPNQTHSISFRGVQPHLYALLTRFLDETLGAAPAAGAATTSNPADR